MAQMFMPHGMCFLWQTDLLLLHVLSDSGIAGAYFSIPLALAYFVKKRVDLEYKWVFALFASFIVACGITHLFGIWVIWNPDYYIEGIAKAMTALISVTTAILLWPLLPKLLALPSPAQLRRANEALEDEIETRKLAQVELQQLNQELERRVAERTRELARSNEDLEKFAYHASHDLKAPLRAVNQLSQFIEEDLKGKVGGDIGENLQMMRSRVTRMEQMLDDLLEYSRVGKAESVEDVSVDRLLADVVELAAAPEAFEIVIDNEIGAVPVARMPLQQVLLNLISNAIKHHDKNEGKIVIVARQTEDRYSIEVSDDGPGIDPQHHEAIFDLFRTLKPKDRTESTGVGLAIAKRGIENMGGTIAVASDGSRGTAFTIMWPKGS